MEREQLVEELQRHQQLREQAIANANAISGVVQYLQQKLAEYDAKPKIIAPPPGVMDALQGKGRK